MTATDYFTRARGAYLRATARFAFSRPQRIELPRPLISFTFDDFPRSALLTAGAMLHREGLAGTYYTAFGLMGGRSATGLMFETEDIPRLLTQRHELGCHTFAHCHSWETDPAAFEASIIENSAALQRMAGGVSFETFSYPISPPKARTKHRTARHFACCRGGGQTFNAGVADLNYLAAYFLEKAHNDLDAVCDVIERNKHAGGWLLLATHDVDDDHTVYGCTPKFFEGVLRAAVDSGSRILPVNQALAVVRESAK
jgi:peptidoglycan/xylan/chitin deacetylase (PgdA/CDA1 family)